MEEALKMLLLRLQNQSREMGYTSNTHIIRRELLRQIVQLFADGRLEDEIDRIPIKMAPKKKPAQHRCCIHKERAVIKYKMFPLLGFTVDDEKDELVPLRYYAEQAKERQSLKNEILTVVDEACTSCVKAQYVVSNLCRGCVARPCIMNCPKGAVSMQNGQAKIDPSSCINCGICKNQCQYHAIIHVPIPCEAACPVGAISKDEFGVERIDDEKCIYCGKCLVACPFGSIFEVSQIIDVMMAIRNEEHITAMFAPSIHGQFNLTTGQIESLLKEIGFNEVVEVADGARQTVIHESAEFEERMESGQSFMTTSCCPSYVEAVDKHVPGLRPFVSDTPSPMMYAADIARSEYPGTKTVFIGPCIGKRKEARKNEKVDFVMSFEELNAMIVALDIDLGKLADNENRTNSKTLDRGFALSGGVAAAVKAERPDIQINELAINGIDKKALGMLKAYAKGKAPANFIEVMCCEGGCINGPASLGELAGNRKLFNVNLK
ncbi:monomeric [FeFe] hydrogenase [Maribellus sp. YY47]|uniref:monomeric [FeFe] hydrogenase n=1 Tax=Maribellus sp. YY47 TaxID=2929486 RepID=UPI002000CBCD|nr:monomeric [FeFe] hydrogenase [Maribellus sp. YY47]MCK3685038.1 monomeric [FeFe] hydrogenase [Maribellus sp. YY47]